MVTVLSFLLAIGLLIAVHEYGHYKVARLCGVKVLRFSIGFGPPLLRWHPGKAGNASTEFVLAAFPLGGYVRMLDEREGVVAPEERHLAFNTQPLRSRAAIVAAGPLANLLLAVLLYALVSWVGVKEPRAILASPVAQSVADKAGLTGGEWVWKAGNAGDSMQDVRSFETLRWLLTRSALDGNDVILEVSQQADGPRHEVTLPLAALRTADADAGLLRKIGLIGPWTQPTVGDVLAGSPAQKSGLEEGDRVLRVEGKTIIDGQQLRRIIRSSVRSGQPLTTLWEIERAGRLVSLRVTPEVKEEGKALIGRIGAFIGAAPEMITVRQGPLDSLWTGLQRTSEVSMLTLRMMGRMVIGEASLKNLSGPLTIADYAGKSANLGVTQYLVFLALISVSLGVLNLLPLPVLDGGHLMYYLWEGLTGSSVSEQWMGWLQRGGVAVLVAMLSIALFNDVTRLFG